MRVLAAGGKVTGGEGGEGEFTLRPLVVLDTSLTCVPFLLPLFARDSEAHPSERKFSRASFVSRVLQIRAHGR